MMHETTLSEGLSPAISQETIEPLRVLLIDDSQGVRRFLASVLKTQGVDVVGQASGGREGLALYEQLRPDLVFLDVVMPVVPGIEVLKQIKEVNPEAIVIMLTSVADRESVLESKEAGAFRYLLKPFEVQKIRQIVDNIKRNIAKKGEVDVD